MPVASQPRSAPAGVAAPSPEIAILWLTAGLSCDGDSVAMTAATQPSLEDLLSGAIPGRPGSSSTIPSWPPRFDIVARATAGDADPALTFDRVARK